MVTEEQYKKAVADKNTAEATIQEFHKEKQDSFQQRLKDNPIFADDELIYSATARCPCGYGLAYPKSCGFNHYWDCAGILTGKEGSSVQHTGRLPFAFYEVKSEQQTSAEGCTTRGTVIPQKAAGK